jgi:D-3-phosphoglycerate dehydrogenase
MADPVDALVADLLEWIGQGSRAYPEVMEVWRTSCPRLPVWEEANARGFIEQFHEPGEGARVALTPLGLDTLRARRRAATPGRDRPPARA